MGPENTAVVSTFTFEESVPGSIRDIGSLSIDDVDDGENVV